LGPKRFGRQLLMIGALLLSVLQVSFIINRHDASSFARQTA
jgi:hypothetical protein